MMNDHPEIVGSADDPDRPDPTRWETGDWDWDPANDPDWDNPAIPRRRIDPGEIPDLADAVVRGASLTYCVIPDLRALIDAVQAHADARLARAQKDADGFLRRTGVFDRNGNEVEGDPTSVNLRGCVVERCNFENADIWVALRVNTRFESEAQFYACRFAGAVCFTCCRMSKKVDFQSSSFASDASFEATRFRGYTSFNSARCSGDTLFVLARFGAYANFSDCEGIGCTDFLSVSFDRGTNFRNANLHSGARFTGAKFGGDAQFNEVTYRNGAAFGSARFLGWVSFDRASFAGKATFEHARFVGDVRFAKLKVAQRARLTFERVRFEKSVAFDEATIRGRVFFTNATLDERLTLDGATFGRRARLGFNRFLARGGATVELRREHLEPDWLAMPDGVGLGGRRPRPMRWRAWEALRPVRIWLGQCRPYSIIEGADSRDPDEMNRAAHDYEVLAANYRNQPATDREEDVCRWRAHELRRRARAAERLQQLSWRAPLASLGRALLWLVLDVLGRWLLVRTCVGYLLQPHRLLVTGAAIILGFALVYWLCIGIDDISHGGFTPRRIADVGWDYPDAYRYWKKDWLNPFYLSLTTFVTLGYGDFQPAAGWLKLATAIEGICGVTLLALFTVAWGRKMVR